MAVTASADPVIEADGELLFEALSNLIDNALKFTPAAARCASPSPSPPRVPA